MDTGLLITTGALLVALIAVAIAVAYVVRRRRVRTDVQLSIAPRLQAWVEPPVRKAPEPVTSPQPEADAPQPAELKAPIAEGAPPPSNAAESTEQPGAAASPSGAVDLPGEFEPLAPIEITVGDDRVALTEGTETHRRLREYADHLLGDLKAARRRTR